MTQFDWISESDSPPARWDLRYLGWTQRSHSGMENSELDDGQADRGIPCPILLDWRPAYRLKSWREFVDPRWVLALGVDNSDDRARLLAEGLGEVLPTNIGPVELAERALRLGANAHAIQRYRPAGPVTLDLFHRDGRIERQWLGLHPREFALLWRLAEEPGKRVTRRELLSDVWRIDHDPETNSVEVHISRLRSKLSISRASWLVVTDPKGGYRLGIDGGSSFFAYGRTRNPVLDSAGRIVDGDDAAMRGERNEVSAQRAGGRSAG